MKKLILAAATVALLGTAATSTADAAAGCPKWACGSNGVQLNGISRNGMHFNGWRTNGLGKNGLGRNGMWFNGIQTHGMGANGLTKPVEPTAPVVDAVVLPSGETVDLR